MTGIYQIQSTSNSDRIYIGSAVDIHSRWRVHTCQLLNNKHHSLKLQRHYNKYGKNDLVFSIVILCDKEDLLVTEQYYIDLYKPYFNIRLIAGCGGWNKGLPASAESNEKRSKKLKGRPSPMKGKTPWNKGKGMSTEDKLISKRKSSKKYKLKHKINT